MVNLWSFWVSHRLIYHALYDTLIPGHPLLSVGGCCCGLMLSPWQWKFIVQSKREGTKRHSVNWSMWFPSCIAGACDLVKGKWVPDARPPDYTNETCRFIQGHQNCMKNGRPDVGYLHWKWQPDQCDLPRINAKSFLKAMRDRSMVFAGDSIARNQFQSLLCLLSQVFINFSLLHGANPL